MIYVNVPSYGELKIKYVIFDYNGTLATDGIIKEQIKQKIEKLSEIVDIYVLTADTYGTVRKSLNNSSISLHIINKENGSSDKLKFIKELNANDCVVIGNGNNDKLMLKDAQLSICILGDEGCSVNALKNSDILVKSVEDCLELLLKPNRLKATLRG